MNSAMCSRIHVQICERERKNKLNMGGREWVGREQDRVRGSDKETKKETKKWKEKD